MDLLTSLAGFSITLYLISLSLAGLFIRNQYLRCKRNPVTLERRRKGKMTWDMLVFFAALILFFGGMAFMNGALFLQSYRIFAEGKTVAEIIIKEDTSQDADFIIHIRELGDPLDEEKKRIDEEYQIKGDLWTIRGNIIRFNTTFSLFGFKPVYQLTRVQGDYYSIDDEKEKERSVHSIIDPSREKWWRWMMEKSDSLPFVELTYGSSVTHNATVGSRFVIKVLPTGFALEKVEDE